ncbi:hypothetical protein I620_04185 [Listeria monocytogenes SHL011]|nr:hypothetical protein I618_02175 [Listeria monocytogenes SHL009]KHK30806.1 hypothetical protein I620_04185 [Listeria monocytogenes SHL011]KHK37833.1 hypothetical protein I622_02190 [Listeria monocytogenes SHL013]
MTKMSVNAFFIKRLQSAYLEVFLGLFLCGKEKWR